VLIIVSSLYFHDFIAFVLLLSLLNVVTNYRSLSV
jgi:hypothetical protein